MQATLMQVPPTLSRSTMMTLSPALARSIARDLPAFPPPTTSRSTSSTGTSAWLVESLLTVDWDMGAHLLRRLPVGTDGTPGQRGARGLYSKVVAESLADHHLRLGKLTQPSPPPSKVIEVTYPFIPTDTWHHPPIRLEQPEPHPGSRQAWRNSRQWMRPWQSPRGPRYQRNREVMPESFAQHR